METGSTNNNNALRNASTPSVTVNFAFMVAYMAGLSAFGSFVNDMYVPSLPEMARFFGCTVPTVQLGLTMGMAGLALGQFLLGPISDKYGRKPVLVASLALFVIAAVISVFSPTVWFFLWCRFAQGLGASGAYFLARTIPTDIYGGRQLARTMALIGAINGLAPASAPVLGGFIDDRFTWKGVFWILAGLALLLILFSFSLKETLPVSRREKGSLLRLIAGYKTLLANRRFMIHVMLKGSALGLLFAYISSAPFIIQTHFGYTQIQFGLFMGFNALFVAAGSILSLKFKPLKRAAVVGALILLAAVAAEVVALWSDCRFWTYELLMLPVMFGLGMLFSVGNTLAMNEGRADAGGASAIVGIVGYIFGGAVSPLVGLGEIMHSTAVVMGVLALVVILFALLSRRLPADLGN
ncbi:MAG: multidrug effflux MFS transporter [Clostridium sp.]|nr:multidrug effflux MFS transporter [Clostridium sp.]